MKLIICIVKWVTITIGALVLIVNALVYRMEAKSRSAVTDWATSVSTEDNGKYTVKYSFISESLIYLKLHESATNELLATRTYRAGNIAQLNWTKDHLGYDTTEQSWFDRGKIDLPPSKLDKFLTYLP